jgi:mRNA deadenylase 3'-5' endonuclease subunit Ccr4
MFTEDSTFEPLLTSLSRSTKGTVDYVWYFYKLKPRYSNFYAKNTRLFVDQVAEVPKAELLIKYHCFPNEHFPSDHISMVVDFGYDK